MKIRKLSHVLIALTLILGAGKVCGQSLPNELSGLTATDILQSENSYSASINFATAQDWDRYGGKGNTSKVFLYRFTLSEPSFVGVNATISGNTDDPFGNVEIWKYSDNGQYWNNYGNFFLSTSTTGQRYYQGVYLMLITDVYYFQQYQTHPTLNLSVGKAAVPITNIPSFPYNSGDITLSPNETKLYRFTITEPAVLNTAFSYDHSNGDIYGLTVRLTNLNGDETGIPSGIAADGAFLIAGTYYYEILNYLNDTPVTFSFNINTAPPTGIPMPYDGNITLTNSWVVKVLKFTLPSAQTVTFNTTQGYTPSNEWTGANTNYPGSTSNFYAEVQNSAGNSLAYFSSSSLRMADLPAGDYYVVIQSYYHGEESFTFNLKISAQNSSNIPSYIAIDYSATLAKNVFTNDEFAYPTDLGYIAGESFINGEMYNMKQYVLLKAYTLNVTAGKKYHFSDYYSTCRGFTPVVLKSGALSGNVYQDIITMSYENNGGNGGEFDFYPTESGMVRVLLFSNNYDGGNYTFRVTETDAATAPLTLAQLCDATNKLITYSPTLSYDDFVNVTAQMPLVRIPYLGNIEVLFQAVAYKCEIPANNSGVNLKTNANFLVYKKENGVYTQVAPESTGEMGDYLSETTFPSGEYYIVLTPQQEGETLPSFYLQAWVGDNEPDIPLPTGTITIKQLLDATTASINQAQLLFNNSGTITAGSANVFIEHDKSQWYPYFETGLYSAKAWKISSGSQSQSYSLQTTFDGVFIYAKLTDDGGDVDDYYYYLTYYISNSSDGGANQYHYFDLSPNTEYYIVGVFESEGGGAYNIQIADDNDDLQPLTIVSLTADKNTVDIPTNASDGLIKAILQSLRLTGTLSNGGGTVNFYSYVDYWNIAPNRQSASFDVAAYNEDQGGYSSYYSINPSASLTVALHYVTTGIHNVVTADFEVYSAGKTLYIIDAPAGETYRLFDISGRTVSQGIVRSNLESLQTDRSGVYILRVGKQIAKVLVK